MEDIKLKKPLPSDSEAKDDQRLETQKRVFHRWVNHKIRKVYEPGLEEATAIFRKPDALLCLARQLAKSKPVSATYHPPEGCSDLENAVGLIDRLYGQDIASAVQLASNVITKCPTSPTVNTCGQLSLALDVMWMLIVAAGAGTGPIEDVTNSMGSSTSTLTRRSGPGSIHAPDGVEITSARTPLLDRWLTRQDERLLAWCQDVTQDFQCINITNFTSSWRDGLAFLAILHRQRPELFSYEERLEKPSSQNLGLAFHLASRDYGIPRLLETEDLFPELVDARAVAAYLTEVRAAVERERKRHSGSNYFELRTPAMEANASAEGEYGATVTVATTSSRSSSPTCSENTFYDDDAVEEEEAGSADDLPVDPEDFQQRMERLLAWMLSVEEKIGANLAAVDEPQKNGESKTTIETTEQETAKANFLHIRKQLETARNCFNVHEGLAGHMTRHQPAVSRCLRNGDRLCSQAQKAQRPTNMETLDSTQEAQASSVDAVGVRKMMVFITKKWTELNKTSEAAGKRLAEILLARQQELLQAVESHLEKLEVEKERQANEVFGTNIRELRSQMTANRRLETNIEAGDELVTGLKDIVILIPTDKDAASSGRCPRDEAIEGKIADLATRWGRLVDWVHTRYAQLQNALLYWRHFDEEAELLSDWLDEREREAKRVEEKVGQSIFPPAANASTNVTPVDPTIAIASSDPVADAIAECLSRHESRWAQLLASLDRRARAVREACGDSSEVQRNVETRVDELVSRWSQLTEPHLDWDETTASPQASAIAADNLYAPAGRMDESQSSVSQSRMAAESDPNDHSRDHMETKEGEATPQKLESAEESSSGEHGRMSPVPTGYKAEFEARAERLLTWLDSSAVALELVTMKPVNNQEQGRSPERNIHEVYARITKEIAKETQTKALVRSLGERYRQELSQAGENVDELDQLFDEIDDRWAQVESLLLETKRQANLTVASSSDNEETSSDTIGVTNVPAAEPASSTADGIPPSESEDHTLKTPVDEFKDWLTAAEKEVDTKISNLNGNTLDDVISQFAQVVQAQPTAAAVEEICSKAGPKDGEELRSRWVEVKRGLSARMKILHNLCENHDLLINQLDRFEKLMTDMLEYLNSVSRAQPSESSAIEAQLQESVEALRDMENMRPDLRNMDTDTKKLEESFSPVYLQSVRQRIAALRSNWDRISHMTEENISDLRGMLEVALANEARMNETQVDEAEDSEEAAVPGGILVDDKPPAIVPLVQSENLASAPTTSAASTVPAIDVQALEKWMTKAKHSLTRFKVIPDEQVFEEFKKFLENMQKEIDSKKPILAAMRSGFAADLNGETVSDTSVLLFSGHFADLESQFFTESERMKAATYHLNDFNSLLAYEKNWLDRVNLMVRRSMQQVYIDVEAMADDISILENLEQEHSKDDFSRLQQLTRLLVAAQVMAQKVTSDFEHYEKAVGEASEKIRERLESLKSMKDRAESTEARLDEYETWLRETEEVVQQRLDDRINADSNPDEFNNWCSHVAAMDELVGTVKRILAKGEPSNGAVAEEKRPVGSLAHRIKRLQIQSMNFKRLLLHYSYSVKCEDNLSRIHEDIQHFDSEANQLEIKALSTTELNTLLEECATLRTQFEKTNENIGTMIETVVNTSVRPELQKCNKELEDEIRDLQGKSAKIEAHVNKFCDGVRKLLPLAERHAALVDPLEQVITNVEEVTDYLETVDSTDSHREMLQRVYAELNQVCGQTSSPSAEMVNKVQTTPQTTSIPQIEALISDYDNIVAQHGRIDGLNNCLMRIRRMIEKAFAARSAFRAHLEMLENAPTATEVESQGVQEGDFQRKQRPPALQLDGIRCTETSTESPTVGNLDISSDRLAAEMTAYLDDIAGFTKHCLDVENPTPSVTESEQTSTLTGRPKTSILECTQKVQLFLGFSQHYFKQQAEYLESRLNDLLNQTASLHPAEATAVMELQKFWNESRRKLALQDEHIQKLSNMLKDAETALDLYEKQPTDERKSECQIHLTQLEETYKLDLESERARIEHIPLRGSTVVQRKVAEALESANLPGAFVSFRESLQQLASQLNEIQGELKSCYHIATHELLGCIQNLDQFFLLAQESASKTAEMLKSCRLQHAQIVQDCVSNLDFPESVEEQQTDRSEFHWLSAVLETQNVRLATYCRQFHMCRPYWQEYATLWQTFTTEAVRQKHQIEMLQLNRLPSEQISASSKRNEASIGTIRDHAVNLCSSALTLQRLGTKLVWKARHSELALGLNAVAYLEDVTSPADSRASQKSLRHQETLNNDVEFVCLTFDAVVSDLCNLAKSHKIESFLPPNLKIDLTNIANELHSEIGVGEVNELQETTFPQAKRESSLSAEVSVTDVEACMDRLGEEIVWLKENGLLIPLNNTQAHYATQRDSEFWCGAEFSEQSPAAHLAAPRLCSSWVRKKSQELSKLDAALKLHENRTAQLCHISEQLSSTCEDPSMRDQLREAADELHISMETARGIVNRRRTRLSTWQSTCATFESALLMDADGEEVKGEQTLPVWIATIRQRLQQSGPDLTSPDFQKELELLCREFDPHGTGTGHTLETVEHTLDAQLAEEERQSVAVACQGQPQLNERVVHSIKASLKEWHAVCHLLKLDPTPVNGEDADSDDRAWPRMHSVEVESCAQSGAETALNKLSFWLDTVRAFVESNKASLGGHFDQETVLARLKQATSSRKGTSYTVKSLYPTAIQMQLQQYTLELEARKPQLDRLEEEARRAGRDGGLSDSNDAESSRLASMVEDVRENWSAVGLQVKERLDQLEKIIAATDELKTLERDLDRWMSRTETELASALGLFSDPSISASERKSAIQDIISHLPDGETKFAAHQQKCENILTSFSKEDTQKIRADQGNIQRRWSQLVMRLRDALEGNVQVDSDFIEIPISPRTGSRVSANYQPKMSQPSTLDRHPIESQHPLNKSDIILPVGSRSLEASVHLDNEAQHQGQYEQRDEMGYVRTAPSNGYRGTVAEPMSSSFRGGKVDNRKMERSPNFESSPSARISPETWPLFLAQLRQLNDWLSHRDAAFQQLKGPIGGNSKNVSQRLARHTALEDEIAIYRSQIEETIERGQFILRDQLSESQSGSYGGSEEESDSSEFDQNGFSGESEDARIATKRIARRIRRHLNYLTRRWMELNKNMLAYKLQLNRAVQKLAFFEQILDEAELKLADARNLLVSRSQTDTGSTLARDEQTVQMIWDMSASVAHAITSLDGQALQLSDDGTIISHALISRLDALKIHLEKLRSETNESLGSVIDMSPSKGKIQVLGSHQEQTSPLRVPPRLTVVSPPEASNGGNQAPVQRPTSPADCWLQAFKTVPPPWERCLHPSGSQVPYYKNHATQETQWDHPSMLDLLQRLDDDNEIRFTAYRTAAKFRKLQQFTFFDQLPLNAVTEAFARHGLALPICGEGCDGRMMDVTQIVNCLTTLYCRVWDILAANPDVVKVVVTPPNHKVSSKAPLCRTDSTTTTSRDNACISEPTSNQDPHTAGESKTLTRQSSQKKARNCVQGVLCHSSKKTERYNEFTAKPLPPNAKQRSSSSLNEDDASRANNTPTTTNTNHLATRQSDQPETPGEEFSPWVADGSHSRVQKLHTNLRLPDGRLFSLPTCVDLALNLLLNAFDSSRNGSIRVLSFKVAILLLLDASLEDKYQYIFSLVANRDNELDESRLWLLIYECMQLPRQLGEGITSSSLEPTVRSCFKKSLTSLRSGAPAEGLVERDEDLLPTIRMDRFYEWLKLEPQALAWLPALYRLIVAESVVHPVKCAVCQTHPIVGLRYRCLRCLNFDLCQRCFLVGRVCKSHKITHPIKEYASGSTDTFKDFTLIVRNRLRSKDRFRKQNSNPEEVLSTPPPVPSGNSSWRNTWTPSAQHTYTSQSSHPPVFPVDQVRLNGTAPPTPQANRSTKANSSASRPTSIGDGRRNRDARSDNRAGGSINRQRSAGQYMAADALSPSADQEHELIARYSQSLRRQSTPNLAASVGMQSQLLPRETALSRDPTYPSAYDPYYSSQVPSAGWQGGAAMTWDRHTGNLFARPPPPPDAAAAAAAAAAFRTGRENPLMRSLSYRASSQPPSVGVVPPPPPPGSGGQAVYGQGLPEQMPVLPRYRQAASVAGSAGSLDRVLYNLEEENRFLRAEYERLRLRSPSQALRPLRSPSLQQQQQLPHGIYSPGGDRFQTYPTIPVPPNRGYVQGGGAFPVQSGYGQQMQQPPLLPSQVERGAASSGLLYGGSLGRASMAHLGTRGWERSTFELGRFPANASCYVGQDPALGYEMVNEARLLRQHKSRLESRMQLLEDHNRQLEDQLSRLRQYLNLNALPTPHANSRTLVVPENPPLQGPEQQPFSPLQQGIASCIPAGINYGQINQ